MINAISVWLLVAGFVGAGLFNAIGTLSTRNDFARWGYPRWWGVPTAGLEMIGAALIAFPASRALGLAFGAIVIAAETLTVLRHRDFKHLLPLSVFGALIVVSWALQ